MHNFVTALASQTSGLSFTADDAKFSPEAFNKLVKDIFEKIDMLQKWSRDNDESEPVLGYAADNSELIGNAVGNSELLGRAAGDSELHGGAVSDREAELEIETAQHETRAPAAADQAHLGAEDGGQGEVHGDDLRPEETEKTDEVLSFYYGKKKN